MSPTARHPRPTTAVPACEDCDDTGTITDPAPDAPGARPPEPCVSCPGRTLPVTPAERACATVLRAYLAWQLSEDDVAPQVMVDLGASLRTEGLIAGYRAALTPAGRDLLARVDASEQTTAEDP